ncbi:hypothetical protein FRB94_009217 [Tulasnella sp. JGI-2019a]|nr:hypothetical protein FRB93_008346 [Tulasnella sp. JGI-2019a]KAG8995355.1 hypothetical protein FRB94_009217 [Tulasnella sp. JGI-2019a]
MIGNPLTKIAHDLDLPLQPLESSARGTYDHKGEIVEKSLTEILSRNVYGTVFDNTRQAALTGETIPSPSTSLACAVFDPKSTLYTRLNEKEYPNSHMYAESLARKLDSWAGVPLEKVSYEYWGFERVRQGYRLATQ